ncbi:S-type anion channel SLAH3-like [Pistacia vera]|uniref:S-type anion channel SLAH3-like n=1 Tax=Pistacia vera TaxID=55513 RepID=UPI00126378DE|nr:S-type anion channel SLAH3-like [Pistacia vera]XP_031249091.1 S-type anion channel SLAH3-like [Pistacia vera]
MVTDTADVQSQSKESHHHRKDSVSISMPSSPFRSDEFQTPKSVAFNLSEKESSTMISDSTAGGIPMHAKSHSQPIPKGFVVERTVENINFIHHPSRASRFRDRRFDSFKTWSGKLERQLTNLRGGRPQEVGPEEETKKSEMETNLPVDRYFDALEGPELDTLRASEQILLPEDRTWPFLLRFPVSSFGICLGVSSQAILWKTLATSESTKFLHITPLINLVLWFIAVALVVVIFSVYLMKVIFYFEAVRREYYHPIRVNFFFAPWIALLFLAMGVPPSITKTLPGALWYVIMTPIFCFELKLYGQWMSGGQRRLSKVANPSNHLAIVGNFVGALLGASMGLKEGPLFFFAVGLAHYTVLFVTLYQRLPTNETLPKELHPVFFLFVAAPSVASMAWARLQGSFDYGARIAYFICLFLYFSLAVRINFFRGFKFSLAWWAYTFPMTGAAIATIRYSNEVTNVVTRILAVTLSSISSLVVTALLVTTILHAFVLRDLFLNDIAIAISEKRPKHHHHRKWLHHLRHGSSDHKDIENYLKFSPEGKYVEACVDPRSTDNEESIENKL